MASKRKKYMDYLSNPSSKIPRQTLNRLKQKREAEQDTSLSRTVLIDDETTVKRRVFDNEEYKDLFDLGQFAEEVDEEVEEPIPNDVDHILEDFILDEDCFNLEDIDDGWDIDLELNEGEQFCLTDVISDLSSLTFHDLSVLLVTLKVTFNLSSIALNFIIKIISLVLPENKRKHLRNVNQLYSRFCTGNKLKKHFYCQHCFYYIESKDITSCPTCEKELTHEKYFVELPLETELPKILERLWKHLDHRYENKSEPGTIQDVYDGEMYKQHLGPGGFLENKNNVSLLGNTDGVAIFKSSSFSVWPVYAVINELPPKYRFRRENKLLCGLWFDKSKPNFSTFFKPFTEQLWTLCNDGFSVRVPGEEESVTCKALLLQMSCDSPAKCMFQDFMQYNAYYGCPYCLNPGEYDQTGHSHIYQYNNEADNGFGEMRTHEGTVTLARQARQNLEAGKRKFAEKGVKGVSWAYSMPCFNIIDGMCLDYMHAVLLGVMKQLLKQWCSKKDILSKIQYVEVQRHLLNFTPPNNITRAPRPLDELKHWKASEYRSFLLFYGPACLYGKLSQMYYDHFMLLSSAIWLLLQERISAHGLDAARRHLQYFTYQMSTLYGSSSMTFSVHLLLHLPHTVKMNGPLWCQSCFFFEDYNSELRQFFHSSQHPDSQVIKAVSVTQCLHEMALAMTNDSEAQHLQRVMKADRYKSKCLTEVGPQVYLVGNGLEEQPSTELASLIHQEHDPFFCGPVLAYKRALIKGQMLHSRTYQKVTKRNSYFVELMFHGQVMYGEIERYILCNNKGLALINVFDVTDKKLTIDDTTGTLGQHIVVVECRSNRAVLVPMESILHKVMVMKLNQQNFYMIAKFANLIEKD